MRIVLFLIILLVPGSALAQSVDILWQGETYTPPFFQGKSLWSTQSKITLVAIPHGLGNSSNLNFKWIRNGTVLGSLSGRGRNTLVLIDDILSNPQNIDVEIISSGNEVVANRSVYVEPISPVVVVYENNPLYGFVFHKAVGQEYSLKSDEIMFTAFPFFFNASSRTSNNLSYEWRTDNGGLETRSSVIYRTQEDASGSSQVFLKVFNKNEVTQDARKSFLVKFGQ